MTTFVKFFGAALVMAAALLAGCVSPGPLDESMVGRYERVMAARGPQQRGPECTLQNLEPITTTEPPLQTVQDETTGKTRVMLSLSEALLRAMSNSLDIRVSSYDPAIARQDVIEAAAEFDYVVFGNSSYQHNEFPTATARTTRTLIDPVTQQPVTVPVPSRFLTLEDDETSGQVGIRQKTITGARWELGWTLTRSFDERRAASRKKIFDATPSLTLTQPLLRDAWPEFNLARLRVARLNEDVAMQEFRRQVEQVASDTITAYWLLIQARRDWVIQKALLDRTIETRDRIDKRRAMDATDVEFKQAQAAVETRRASLIIAEKRIDDVQDQLVRLMADQQLNLVGNYEILPTTEAATDMIQIDTADQLVTALRHSPLMAEARLAIEIADITVRVAQNQTLPRLDLTGGVSNTSAAAGSSDAIHNSFDGKNVSYNLLLEFEYPLCNRERLAELQKQQLNRLKSITQMQLAADTIAVQVRERIRQVTAAHEEMVAQHRAVEASRDQLDALDATEQLRRMTPEFLQVKLSAQETLSNAARAELQAIVDYNIALANLAQVTGTILELNQIELAIPAVMGEVAPEKAVTGVGEAGGGLSDLLRVPGTPSVPTTTDMPFTPGPQTAPAGIGTPTGPTSLESMGESVR